MPQSDTLDSAPARPLCLLVVRLVAPSSSAHSRGGPRPPGSQPRPQLLELAASKDAHFTAFDHSGGALSSTVQAMRHGGCGMEAWLLDPTKAKESLMLARASRLTLVAPT